MSSYFNPNVTELPTFSTKFNASLEYQISPKPVQWERTDMGTDMTGAGTIFSTVKTHLKRALYRGAEMSLAQPGRKQATSTEYFDFHTSYL
jgi:hypothetical protein